MVRTLGRSLVFGYHELVNWLFPCFDRTEPTITPRKRDSDSDFNPVPFRTIHIQTSECVSTESVMEMQRFHVGKLFSLNKVCRYITQKSREI